MKVKGLDSVIKGLDIDIDFEKELLEVGREVLSEAKSNVHVDSGALRNSLDMRVSRGEGGGMVVSIGSDLEYAPYEEYGVGGGVFLVTNGSNYAFTDDDKNYAKLFKGGQTNIRRTAHPYLSPAGLKGYNKLMVKIAEKINKAVK